MKVDDALDGLAMVGCLIWTIPAWVVAAVCLGSVGAWIVIVLGWVAVLSDVLRQDERK
jgi:hypothetical protein